MFNYTEMNMDENLKNEIKNKLEKGDENDLEDILENYKGLNFIHIWAKQEKTKTYKFHLATLSASIASTYFAQFCEDDEENTHSIHINQIWELSQETIKHPYEDRKLDIKEIKKIYKSLEQDFL